ncbi:MAG: hypothetical protein ACI9WL_001343 [Rubritalea sp.]|jgi:hypothetical protein
MRNSNIISLIVSSIIILMSSFSFAQENTSVKEILPNSLDEITLTVKKSSLKENTVFIENKKHLRKAARLSKGDIYNFKEQILRTVPSFTNLSDTDWKQIFAESKLLTFQGKIEEIPSVF